MTNLKNLITSDKIKGIISVVSAVVIYFTPDHIDIIIQSLLGIFGIAQLAIKKQNEK